MVRLGIENRLRLPEIAEFLWKNSCPHNTVASMTSIRTHAVTVVATSVHGLAVATATLAIATVLASVNKGTCHRRSHELKIGSPAPTYFLRSILVAGVDN